jgi:hypothetical protein
VKNKIKLNIQKFSARRDGEPLSLRAGSRGEGMDHAWINDPALLLPEAKHT